MSCEAQLTATQTGKGKHPGNVRIPVQDYISVLQISNPARRSGHFHSVRL